MKAMPLNLPSLIKILEILGVYAVLAPKLQLTHKSCSYGSPVRCHKADALKGTVIRAIQRAGVEAFSFPTAPAGQYRVNNV